MPESTVRIGLVLPDVMGTYGDGGNALVLRQRLRMRGYDAEIVPIGLEDPVPDSMDLYTLGGAEDSAQRGDQARLFGIRRHAAMVTDGRRQFLDGGQPRIGQVSFAWRSSPGS